MTDEELYEIDSSHTDPTEQETALCLKYRQRARDAEAVLDAEHSQRVIMQRTLEAIAGDTKEHSLSNYNAIIETIKSCRAIRDKQLEDVLMPDKEIK